MPAPIPPALVLVVNAGSSSLKASLVDGRGQRPWQQQRSLDPGAAGGVEALLEGWLLPEITPWLPRLERIAHRVVHGGERFTAPTALTPAVVEALEALVPLAPLHNAAALEAIRWFSAWGEAQAPGLRQWACFDTGFHATLPEAARTYAIPAGWRAAGLRRFGFHGLSHQHVAEQVAVLRPGARRLISCHLGAGCSLCAIRLDPSTGPRSVATTMGFTPLEGLVMASRSGSVDPGLLLHQLRQGLTPEAIDEALQCHSGLLGLSELSGDMRTLRQAAAQGHQGAQLALAVFRQRLLEGIGAMAACLQGVEVIALTGGIGEHDQSLVGELGAALGWLEPFTLLQVSADEEGLMARLCREAG
ncbi:acetate/propionate family kinase [Cyanobium sp. NIES-981]|uniref:acetate/propionate family kinase n=1 Tax=Cyanobium sp. NIES-981 TaxID=1851505 RepID=UPI0007DE3022|nr:acetate kinase [Cyanobium sp. NIES-981]SBO42768.1 Acetate kinase [Cyanobium sp. NIES-981]